MIYTASLTCADPLRLYEDVQALLESGIDTLHLDVMDGHHVPALGLNLDTITALRKAFPTAVLDAHLMVANPQDYFKRLQTCGVDWCTIVPRTVAEPTAALDAIRALGMRAGFVLNLDETVAQVVALLSHADLAVVMAIPSGGYGRPFQSEAYTRIGQLAALRAQQGYGYLISVDGGVTLENGRQCREMGADVLVEGMFTLFGQPQGIRQACQAYLRGMEEA